MSNIPERSRPQQIVGTQNGPARAQKGFLGNIHPSAPGLMLFLCLKTDGQVSLTHLGSLWSLYSVCHKSVACFDELNSNHPPPVLPFILASTVRPSLFPDDHEMRLDGWISSHFWLIGHKGYILQMESYIIQLSGMTYVIALQWPEVIPEPGETSSGYRYYEVAPG